MGSAPTSTPDLTAIFRFVTEWLPGVRIDQLIVSHAHDDDGIWYFSLPGRKGDVHIESSSGACPFEIASTELDDAITGTDPRDAALTISRLLTALPVDNLFSGGDETLRIYVDFNSRTADGLCWCLRYREKPFDEVAAHIGATDGMPVVLYYSDDSEEFECAGTLLRDSAGGTHRWLARPDEKTFRRLR